jgi:hypothetical protein
MAPAGAGAYSERYAGLRRLATSHTAPVSATTPIPAATTKMPVLYFWKKLFFRLDAEKCCGFVVSFPLSRVATKSAWAAAGSVVERI